ncbi:molybdate ABC transporter substrate-binding protein [Mycobacterium sp. pUA109]|uniref:molybdate ABC transporter substrate-binding protein n=1 Tax=Mycobacterium sp. pUA109 TaxID=3238982 RepID=UPI00351AF2CB
MYRRTAALSALVAAGVAGCGSPAGAPSITVLAAASLKPTFTQIGERFMTEHPGTTVRFDFASSSDLAAQLTQGATGDVFASADTAQMDTVATAGLLATAPVDFASNTLVIVTAPGNPKHVASFADLAQPGLAVVVSPPPMPCGVATRRVEDLTGVHLDPVSEEPDPEDVLNKVATGEADAGVVNATDARAAGEKISTVAFPEAVQAASSYPIAALQKSAQPALAQGFVDLVTGVTGQQILARAGFAKP